jgi:membrane protease subunit (stomatin/prohibitin family)
LRNKVQQHQSANQQQQHQQQHHQQCSTISDVNSATDCSYRQHAATSSTVYSF